MTRHQTKNGMQGHFPTWVIDRLKLIDELKDQDYSNDEIAKILKKSNTKRQIRNVFGNLSGKSNKTLFISYVAITLAIVIIVMEVGVLPNTSNKQNLRSIPTNTLPNHITSSGSGLLPRNIKRLFVKTPNVTTTSKVYVSFYGDYAPATRHWIYDKIPLEGFYIELDTPTSTNVEFSWWVTQ